MNRDFVAKSKTPILLENFNLELPYGDMEVSHLL